MTPTDAASSSEIGPSTAATARGLLTLLLQVVLLLLASLGSVIAFVLFVPEVNDYARASAAKHARLASASSPKIVLTGGSNLAFGIDSPMIEKATGRPVINMGMDGYLGVSFLLAEVEPYLKASDLVVIALEHDSYIIPSEGVPESQFAIVKANPAAWEYLTAAQKKTFMRSAVVIAQAKVNRLMVDAGQTVQTLLSGVESPWQMAEHIGTFAGFNEQGDFTSHLDTDFPARPADGLDLRSKALQPTIELLRAFQRRMRERNVRVLISYPPVAEPYYATYRSTLAELHAGLSADGELLVPTPPSEFVYPEGWFFDTVYHLKRHGRELRTRRLLGDIEQAIATSSSTAASREP